MRVTTSMVLWISVILLSTSLFAQEEAATETAPTPDVAESQAAPAPEAAEPKTVPAPDGAEPYKMDVGSEHSAEAVKSGEYLKKDVALEKGSSAPVAVLPLEFGKGVEGDASEAQALWFEAVEESTDAALKKIENLPKAEEPAIADAYPVEANQELPPCMERPACVEKIAKLTQEQFLLGAKMTKVDGADKITLAWIEATKKETLAQVEATPPDRKDLKRTFLAALAELTKAYPDQLPPRSQEKVVESDNPVRDFLDDKELNLVGELQKGMTSKLALLMVPKDYEVPQGDKDKWEKLFETHTKQGMRSVVVGFTESGKSCAYPGLKNDSFVCLKDTKLPKGWRDKKAVLTLLWIWPGALVGGGTISDMEGLFSKAQSQVPLLHMEDTYNEKDKKMRKSRLATMQRIISKSFNKAARVRFVQPKESQKQIKELRKGEAFFSFDNKVTCPAEPASQSMLILRSQLIKDGKTNKISTGMYSLEKKCFLAMQENPYYTSNRQKSVDDAIIALFVAAVAPMEAPPYEAPKETPISPPVLLMPVPSDPLGVQVAAAAAPAVEEPPQAAEPGEDKPADDGKFKLDDFTMAIKSGYKRSFKFGKIYDEGLDERDTIEAAILFHFGGEGFGFQLEPFYNYQMYTGGDYDIFHVAGAGIGFAYQWVINQYVMPSVGLSFRGGYMFGPDVQHGFETYVRVPIAYSLYVIEDFGFIIEVAPNYGMTGILQEGASDLTLAQDAACNNDPSLPICDGSGGGLRFAHGFGVDVSFGIRFP